MKTIIPPGGLVSAHSGSFRGGDGGDWPAVLVMIEIVGGPTVTLTPVQWAELVSKIRAAPSAASLGA